MCVCGWGGKYDVTDGLTHGLGRQSAEEKANHLDSNTTVTDTHTDTHTPHTHTTLATLATQSKRARSNTDDSKLYVLPYVLLQSLQNQSLQNRSLQAFCGDKVSEDGPRLGFA
jgi:hypothetical protein